MPLEILPPLPCPPLPLHHFHVWLFTSRTSVNSKAREHPVSFLKGRLQILVLPALQLWVLTSSDIPVTLRIHMSWQILCLPLQIGLFLAQQSLSTIPELSGILALLPIVFLSSCGCWLGPPCNPSNLTSHQRRGQRPECLHNQPTAPGPGGPWVRRRLMSPLCDLCLGFLTLIYGGQVQAQLPPEFHLLWAKVWRVCCEWRRTPAGRGGKETHPSSEEVRRSV